MIVECVDILSKMSGSVCTPLEALRYRWCIFRDKLCACVVESTFIIDQCNRLIQICTLKKDLSHIFQPCMGSKYSGKRVPNMNYNTTQQDTPRTRKRLKQFSKRKTECVLHTTNDNKNKFTLKLLLH